MDPSATNGASKRALVVVNEQVAGSDLRDALLRQLGDQVSEVFVVAPALVDSGLKHTMGDVDDAIEPARERLRVTLEELRRAGLEARGEVGDSDPMQAINDEILKFEPDQVLVVAHRDEDGAFAEKGLLEQIDRDLDLPVLELVVGHGKEPAVLDVKRSEPIAGRKKGWRPSGNWPPLSGRNVAGIVVAIVGTLLLGALAAACVNDGGDLAAACVARVLIALGMALINLAHVVGLLLFQSVNYEGIFSRFVARLSLYGTPVAIVISLLLGLAM
jgi:hypothetical protein